MRYIPPPKETPLGWEKVLGHDYVFDKVVNDVACRLAFVFIDDESGFYQVYIDLNRPYVRYSLDSVNSLCEKETLKINKLVDLSFKFVKKVILEIFEFNGKKYWYMNNAWYYFIGDVKFPVEDAKIKASLNRLYKAWIKTNE